MRPLLTDLRGNPISWSYRHHRWRHSPSSSSAASSLRTTKNTNLPRNIVGSSGSSTNRVRHPHLPTLFYLIRNRSWMDVIRRCQTHPQEICCQEDSTGNTPLHLACQLDPPCDVIRHLTTTGAYIPNASGVTPLHIAATHRCSATSLQLLMDLAASLTMAAPSTRISSIHPTAELSRMGRAPIHYACMSFRGLDLEAFCVLLEATLQHGNYIIEKNGEEESEDGSDYPLVNEPVVSAHHRFLDDYMDEEDYFLAQQRQRQQQRAEGSPAGEKEPVNVMTLRDTTGYTPLGLLFRRYRQRVRSVISVIDQIRVDSDSTMTSHQPPPTSFSGATTGGTTALLVASPDRAAVASALAVQADLGTLWGKARAMVARLTEERLQREEDMLRDTKQPRGDGSRSTTNYRSNNKICDSPGEVAIGQEAAAWALEHHYSSNNCVTSDEEEEFTTVATIEASLSSSSSTNTTNVMLRRRRKFRIVHASIGLTGYGCPPEMIRLAISINPTQVREMDEEGNLPLHIAATAASFVSTMGDAPPLDDASSVFSDGMQSLLSSTTAQASSTPLAFDKVIKLLLRHYPEAAQTPHGKTGSLPLALAAQAGHRTWKDGMETLVHSYPPALHSRKLKLSLKLYPYVLALINGMAGYGSDDSSSSGRHHPFPRAVVSKPPATKLMIVPCPPTAAATAAWTVPSTHGSGRLHHWSQAFLAPLSPKRNRNNNISSNKKSGTPNNRRALASIKFTRRHHNTSSSNTQEKEDGSSIQTPPSASPIIVKPRVANTLFELLQTNPDMVGFATLSHLASSSSMTHHP